MVDYSLIINGAPVSVEGSFDVVNPATQEVIAQCPDAGEEQLNLAVSAARAAFQAWSKTDYATRQAAMLAVADQMEAHKDELAELLTLEQGKPLVGCGGGGSRDEIDFSVYWCRMTAELELPTEVVQDDDNARIEIRRKPLGVVASITPWNAPLLIGIWHIIPAMLTGNTVVIKPSAYTPLSTLKLVEVANKVLPPGVLNVLTGEDGIGPLITDHPDINKIIFTGSGGVGKHIMRAAAGTLKRLTLELGGNDAGILLPDVNPVEIAPKIIGSSFNNCGQICASLKRIFVHESIYDEMCEELVKGVAALRIGNGMDDVDYGPVQNQDQFDYLCEVLEDAKAKGGRVLLGGNPDLERKGYFYPPTLIADVTDDMMLVAEETFGPMRGIIKYRDIDDAIERANSTNNGLGGSIWSNDVEQATELADRLECGTSWVNCHAMAQPNVPFGGIKESGMGVEFGVEGLAEYTSIHVVNICKN